jgi:hypothetical protein
MTTKVGESPTKKADAFAPNADKMRRWLKLSQSNMPMPDDVRDRGKSITTLRSELRAAVAEINRQVGYRAMFNTRIVTQRGMLDAARCKNAGLEREVADLKEALRVKENELAKRKLEVSQEELSRLQAHVRQGNGR